MEDHLEVHWQESNGYIDRLEVHNFKSYRGKQQIGPFRNFTAVVGPNGSGKSNLMDAISFVLGVRTAQLRGSLKELLYHNSDGRSDEDRPTRGYVKLIYCTDDGKQVAFARHIQPSSSDSDASFQSVYKVNDKTVTWEAYSQKLGSFGILVKVRNFLVFQGDIEAVAAKSPQGLTGLFEQISGSEAYKQQYEESKVATGKAEERVALAFSRKKAASAERKQKKEQKEEAERFLAKQQELKRLHVEGLLFSLFHLRADRDAAVQEAAQLQQQATKLAQDHATFEDQLESIRRRSASHAKDKLLHEKRIKKLQADRDKKATDVQRAKESSERVNKTISTQEKEISELEGKAATQAAKIKQLEKDLANLAKERAKVEAEAKAHAKQYTSGAGAGLEAAAVQAEYQAVKSQVAEKTAQLEGERETLAAQLKADEDALQQLLDSQQAHVARAESHQKQADDASSLAAKSTSKAASDKKELKAAKDKHATLDDDIRRATSTREHLQRELDAVESQLRDAGTDRKEAKREAKMTEAVAALKQRYPNSVFGRLTDLGKVSRRDYNLALAVAMGKHIDSVVVDTDSTARTAIQYLKEHRVAPMTFIPLQTCKVRQLNERLRSGLGGTARLAFDLVEPERPEFSKAFQFAFENTIVCDTVEEARQLAYGGTERHKVVAKDGTQFAKAGLITGGDAGNFGNKAGRWDDKLVGQLKQQREELIQKLQDAPHPGSLRQQATSLSDTITSLEAQLVAQEAEAKAAKEKSVLAGREAAAADKAAKGMQRQIDVMQAQLDKHQEELQALTDRIHQVADRLFAPFSKKLGVASIREYEDTYAKVQAKTEKQRQELDNKEAKITNQLEFERSRDIQAVITSRKGLLEEDRKKLAHFQSKVSDAQSELDKVNTAMDAEREAMSSADTEIEKAQADLKELRRRGAGLNNELQRLSRAQALADTTIKTAEAQARDKVQGAELDGVQLPRTRGAAALEEVAEAMEVDGQPDQPASGAAADGTSLLDTLDFTHLPDRFTRNMSKQERDSTSRSLTQQQVDLKAELEGMTPNLKALEQYEAIKEKERELNAALEEVRKEAAEAQASFNRCRQCRFDTFMAAFTHISQEIDVIYKELTRSGVHPLGGNAYLNLEQPDEPFLAGIKYTAMPPTKRFRDMEQLSGGEKTVAALALLFAIHSFRPSPFFVLDEVDAALDATNVARVAHYIRDRTRSLGGAPGAGAGASQEGGEAAPDMPGFQSIVISLKDIFYEKADVLVGVARDVDLGCSRTFTFDLTAFGDPLAADV